MAMINGFIASKRFEFQSVTKKQVKETPSEILKDDSKDGMNFIGFEIQHFESESSQFNMNDIDQYACMTFRSDDYAVIVQQEYTEKDCFFVFELRPFNSKKTSSKISE
ncbi:hypothetical protein [Chryseobacterium hagamense]|nr:hypothetical protein [Chryseobacterium hagamense]